MNSQLSSGQICRAICEYESIIIRAFLRHLGSPLTESALEQFVRDQEYLESERVVLICDRVLSLADEIFTERERKAASDDTGTAKPT